MAHSQKILLWLASISLVFVMFISFLLTQTHVKKTSTGTTPAPKTIELTTETCRNTYPLDNLENAEKYNACIEDLRRQAEAEWIAPSIQNQLMVNTVDAKPLSSEAQIGEIYYTQPKQKSIALFVKKDATNLTKIFEYPYTELKSVPDFIENEFGQHLAPKFAVCPSKELVAFSNYDGLSLYDVKEQTSKKLISKIKYNHDNVDFPPAWSIQILNSDKKDDISGAYNLTPNAWNSDCSKLLVTEGHYEWLEMGILDLTDFSYKKLDTENISDYFFTKKIQNTFYFSPQREGTGHARSQNLGIMKKYESPEPGLSPDNISGYSFSRAGQDEFTFTNKDKSFNYKFDLPKSSEAPAVEIYPWGTALIKTTSPFNERQHYTFFDIQSKQILNQLVVKNNEIVKLHEKAIEYVVKNQDQGSGRTYLINLSDKTKVYKLPEDAIAVTYVE